MCRVDNVSGWRGSVSRKAPDHVVVAGSGSAAVVSGRAALRRAGPVLKGKTTWNSMAPTSSCAAWPKKAWNTFSATLAARCFTSTTRFSSRTNSSTFWCVTSRLPCTPPTRTRAPRRKWAYAW
ncbi:Uncharacterised protein [Bordetella pertussis]|nr:Uncharacterised protein [Bordetella pertussis]